MSKIKYLSFASRTLPITYQWIVFGCTNFVYENERCSTDFKQMYYCVGVPMCLCASKRCRRMGRGTWYILKRSVFSNLEWISIKAITADWLFDYRYIFLEHLCRPTELMTVFEWKMYDKYRVQRSQMVALSLRLTNLINFNFIFCYMEII